MVLFALAQNREEIRSNIFLRGRGVEGIVFFARISENNVTRSGAQLPCWYILNDIQSNQDTYTDISKETNKIVTGKY